MVSQASNPYVLAVGGTQGPESGQAEKAWTSIGTSGGGFSNTWSAPSYQTATVSSYTSTAATANKSPAPGFSSNGRAYPGQKNLLANIMCLYS